MFGWIALFAFWGAAIKLWAMDGPKLPLTFIALWLLAFFGFPMLGWSGAAFLAVECIMAVILLIVDRYKSMM